MRINNIYTYQNINKDLYKKQKFKQAVNYTPAFKSLEPFANKLYINASLKPQDIISNHLDKIKHFSPINKDALIRLLGKFKHDFDLSDINSFLQNENNPDCIKLEALLNRLKNEGVFSLYFEPILKIGKKDINTDTNFDIINNFLDFRLKAIENKSLLDKHNFSATISDVDDIVMRNVSAVNKTLELIGEKALIFSFKEKKDNVLAFIKDLGGREWDFNLYDDLMMLTNPMATECYKTLDQEISRLKAFFPKISEPEKLEQLKYLINTLTREKRNLLENSLKDPKEILEKSLIISALNSNGLKDKAFELLKVLNPKNEEEKKLYNETLNRILFEYYGFEISNDKILEKLNFQNNKYLPRLFYTNQDFIKEFNKLIQLLLENPDKTNLEIFNELPKNIQTRLDFENSGIDYDKWVSYDPDSKVEYNIDKQNKLVAQKIDMNNIPKALFIGDESSCCTRVNGVFAKSIVNYITSKMIQAIEVCHNNLPIANTMCYFAKINGRIALILDNIEVLPQYKNDDKVRDIIFEYAKQLMNEIGHTNMPIMLSNKRNDVKLGGYKSYYYSIDIIGNTLNDSIYIDHDTKDVQVNNSTRFRTDVELIPITKKAPIGCNEPSNILFNNRNIMNPNTILSNVLILRDNWDEYINYNAGTPLGVYDNEYD